MPRRLKLIRIYTSLTPKRLQYSPRFFTGKQLRQFSHSKYALPLVILILIGLGGSAVATKQTGLVKENYSIPYRTQVVEDNTQPTGWREIESPGVNGAGVRNYRETHIAGFKTSKNLLSSPVTTEPVQQVERHGVIDTTQAPQYENIPFDKLATGDKNELLGYSSVTQPGSIGQRTLIYNVHTIHGVEVGRELASSSVTTPPVNEVTAMGINYRVGAYCRDTTGSNATGSGACSHHHGVDTWMYAYCSASYSCWSN